MGIDLELVETDDLVHELLARADTAVIAIRQKEPSPGKTHYQFEWRGDLDAAMGLCSNLRHRIELAFNGLISKKDGP